VTDRDEGLVLYLGRLSRAKNIDLLVKAMMFVSKAVSKAYLVLAGPDEDVVKNVIEFARRRSIRLQYLGLVSEAMKHRLYLKSYVYAFPSLYEPFRITLLEAAQHGLPSVITGFGGQLYSAPPNIAGVWAKPNPVDYAQGIVELLTDRNLWRKLSENAMKWSQSFLWDKILPKYEKLYNELII